MSIPFEFDPMGVSVTGEAPVTYTDCNIDFDNFPGPGKGKIPLPYMLSYDMMQESIFFREGKMQITHFLMVADVANTDTYVGILGKNVTDPTREDFLCITDAPVGEVVNKKIVEMRLADYSSASTPYTVVPWGHSWGGWFPFIKPPTLKANFSLSEWRSNGVDESGVETFTWVRTVSDNYINPIQLPTKTEGVTDCPDGKMHFMFAANKYTSSTTPFGFKYTFNPNSTVCPTIQ